jgi:hypothetical protein
MVGINPLDILRADPLERDALLAVVEQAVKVKKDHMKAQAQMIIGELSNAMTRGRRKGG